jgi:hypothetical protein
MHIPLSSTQLPLASKISTQACSTIHRLEVLFSLFEDWWLCVQKIFKVTKLVRFSPLTLVSAMSDVLRHGAQSFTHSTLSFCKHSH